MKLPNLFTCVKCGLAIDPKSTQTLRYVSGWTKAQSRTLVLLDIEHYKYQHDACVGTSERHAQDPLF